MKRTSSLYLFAALAFLAAAASRAQDPRMSFFITSTGSSNGADLGGLKGADRQCRQLASAVGAGGKTWHAYLSAGAADGQPAVNARDRIGTGPWYNYKGVEVASSVDNLHSDDNKLSKQTSLTEKGEVVNGRGDQPNMHDMLTGSTVDGKAFPADGQDHSCRSWTSSDDDGSAQLGHHDRQGGGQHPTSWNSAHPSRGCSRDDLRSTGGNGLFYCFAVD